MTSPIDHSSDPPRLGALWAHELMAVVGFRLLPALAAGFMAAGHLHHAGMGLIVAASFLGSSLAMERSRHPLHLMPLARASVRATVPLVGAGLALAVFALAGSPQPVTALVAPVTGAWAIMLLNVYLISHLNRSRPVRVAVIGSRGLSVGLADELADSGIDSVAMVGWVEGEEPVCDRADGGPRRLGPLSEIREIVGRHSIDLLVHSGGLPGETEEPRHSRLEIFERVAKDCLDLPVRMMEAGQFYEEQLGHVPIGQSNSAWFQYLLHPRYRSGLPGSKRAFDILVGATMLVLAMPLLIAFALAMRLTDAGPVLYRQRRVGAGGSEFEMIKLRSMRVAAEGDGAQWSRADDERVTPIGRLMRSLHVDELPQLWNVLRGEMTLVGPRPERPELIAELELQLPFYDRRHIVKPGIAGWAQARCGYGGSEEGTGWKLCHDLFYLKHRSVYFDMLVLTENVRVSVSRGVQFNVRVPREQFILGPVTQRIDGSSGWSA